MGGTVETVESVEYRSIVQHFRDLFTFLICANQQKNGEDLLIPLLNVLLHRVYLAADTVGVFLEPAKRIKQSTSLKDHRNGDRT